MANSLEQFQFATIECTQKNGDHAKVTALAAVRGQSRAVVLIYEASLACLHRISHRRHLIEIVHR